MKKRPFGFARGFQLSLWLPPLGYALLIFSLSSIKYASVPDVKFNLFDKMIHLCEYGVFGFILAWTFARLGLKHPYLWAALIASLYGATDEIHQYYVPGRTMEFLDWVADTLGGISGSQIYRLWRRKFDKLPAN